MLGFAADHVVREADVAFKLVEEVLGIPSSVISKDNYARACYLHVHCYLNGYGSEVDDQRALTLLSDAMDNADDIFANMSIEKIIPSACKYSNAKALIKWVELGYFPDTYTQDSSQLKNCGSNISGTWMLFEKNPCMFYCIVQRKRCLSWSKTFTFQVILSIKLIVILRQRN